MGKGEQHPLPTTITTHSQSSTSSDTNNTNCSFSCGSITRLFRFRCIFFLILGLSVLLSALYWLPPFFHHGDQGDLDLDDSLYKGHDIVATFMIQKPLSSLQDDLPRLGGDIFDEIRVPTTKVVIITAENTGKPNTTKVVFGVDPEENNIKISPYAKSLVRDSFVSLVLNQSPFRLTESMFGEPSSFEVLKFVGGISVTPDQSAYPLQKVQMRFNFTLNFSIQKILQHFGELTSQLKSGLHLGPYENLHVSLTNIKGSTVAPQTTVQSSIVLVIGTPSTARSKQLAQTIKGSPTKNLGLNNTQFGRVKQVSLSSFYNTSSGGSPTPSPAPLPPPQPHNNHHHHHHHHHDTQLPPAKSPSPLKHSPAPPPVPTPAPQRIHHTMPPDCHSGNNRKKHHPLFPPVSQPVLPPPLRSRRPPPPRPLPPRLPPPPPPHSLPQPPTHLPPLPPHKHSPSSPVPEIIPASSPLPNVVYAHTNPPSRSDSGANPPDTTLQPSSAGTNVPLRVFAAFVVVVTLHLLQQ
ncbi:uncharacterized protein [Rutidosis leptorrhynchoides]|uniref:uncharacterized protein isoform X2 n=1 Tax=Rutidosis leptorrhynchoides TaxID=125765 RepID=UPI003A9955BE